MGGKKGGFTDPPPWPYWLVVRENHKFMSKYETYIQNHKLDSFFVACGISISRAWNQKKKKTFSDLKTADGLFWRIFAHYDKIRTFVRKTWTIHIFWRIINIQKFLRFAPKLVPERPRNMSSSSKNLDILDLEISTTIFSLNISCMPILKSLR